MSASASHSDAEMSASASHSGAEMSASASHSGAEMSARASHSGTDSEALNDKAETVESEAKKTHVPTKAELQTALKDWSASSVIKLDVGESEREYKHPEPPEWECIICNNLIKRTPVYQCQTGHLACSSCSQSGVHCHSCSRAVSRIRNLAVENMINSLVVTCKFAKLGCNEVMKFKELKLKHEYDCSFMPMFCPMPGCKHAGVKNLLGQHLLSEHKIRYLVDVGKLKHSYGGYSTYSEDSEDFDFDSSTSEDFDLDSSTALVMLRNMRFQEFHLLHQQCTAVGDRLEITSLAKTCKRKYKLVVEVGEQLTYCYKSSTTSNTQPTGGLLIPKQSDGGTLKKRCKVSMPEWP